MTALADPLRDDSLTEEIKITDTVRDPRLKPLDLEEKQKIAVTDPRLTPLMTISEPKKQAQLIGQGQGIGFNVEPQLRPDETMPEYLARQGLRTAVTGASAFLGLPGDLLKLPSMVGEAGKELLGEKGQKIFESVIAGGLFDPKVAAKIPGSYEIQEGIKGLASYLGAKEGILDPQTEGEKISDEITRDFATLFTPLGATRGAAVRGANILRNTFAQRVGNAAFVAGGSNIAKQFAKELGAGEEAQGATKLGTAMLLSILTAGRGARRLGNDLRTRAETLIPEGEVYNNLPEFRQRLRQLRAEMTSGGVIRPSEQDTVSLIDDFLRGIGRGNQVTPQDLTRYVDLVNEVRFAKNVNGQLLKRPAADRRNVNRLFDVVNEAVTDYGKNQNPDFLDIFSNAQGALRAEAQGEQLARNLTQSGLKGVNPNVRAALGYTLGGSFGGLAGIIAPRFEEGLSIGLSKSVKSLSEIAKSPVMREYYAKIIKASAENNIPAMSRAVQQLNREYEKEQKEFEKKVPKLQPKK